MLERAAATFLAEKDLICLASVSASAQLNDTYVVTAAANLQGSNNTRWLTQLSLFNPHLDYTLTISMVFLPTASSNPIEKLIDLPPNATFLTDNVLGDVFNRSGGGALLIATSIFALWYRGHLR